LGYNIDVDLGDFIKKWDSVNKSNYKEKENFFFLEPEKWKSLGFI
jgi:hypothetical protein